MQKQIDGKSMAAELAGFVASLSLEDVPENVRHRAKLQILDAIGTGLAANFYPFSERALNGIKALGGAGECSVVGQPIRLSPRDAALANGLLLHGLDFDDTHLASIIHPSVASLPAALAVGELLDCRGADMLLAYIAGMETAIRIGLAANGAFHHTGYHATAIASHFSSAITAGKLLGLDDHGLTMAQGITGSTASGIQVFLEDGAWTKRFHPGWGAAAGITAAILAQNGFVAPTRPYEGKFGLFDTHLQAYLSEARPERFSAELGTTWHLADTAIKPYPVCHFIHGCADAAIELSSEIDPSTIAEIEAFLPEATLPIVAEPHQDKIAPKTDYEAKFSTQFVVATCLARGRFGLAELEENAFSDSELLDLSAKVRCKIDPHSAFPEFFSGGLKVTLKDGRTIAKHIRVNSGAGERALDVDGVSNKFRACAAMVLESEQIEKIRDIVLDLESASARDLGVALSS